MPEAGGDLQSGLLGAPTNSKNPPEHRQPAVMSRDQERNLRPEAGQPAGAAFQNLFKA